MNEHSCVVKFETKKIDDCSGEAYNVCYGDGPMCLEVKIKTAQSVILITG